MAVINGSYGECEKWVGEFSLQKSTATFREKGGSYPKKNKKKVQHAKKTKIPESSEKDRTLKKEDKGP